MTVKEDGERWNKILKFYIRKVIVKKCVVNGKLN